MKQDFAHQIAFIAHSACGQYRADGVTPYIRHPERVALLTREFYDYLPGDRNDREVAAYLHDVVEDTKLTRDHLLDLGITRYQLDIVERLTKEKPNAPATDEYYQRIAESNDALLVKCADRCANLEDATLELKAKVPKEPSRWGRYAEKTVTRILPLYATLPQLRAELERRVEWIEKALPAAVERRADSLLGDAMSTLDRSYSILGQQPYPLLFVTLSGSHLYGFPSADSDFDLRGVHVAPAREILSLRGLERDTIEAKSLDDGFEDELVTHDARKYFTLLLRNNGYVLEQIFSPLVIHDSGYLDQLRDIAKRCITSNHSLHYKGFGYKEWTKFVLKPTKHVKRILYVFRVFMTGIYLMRTGEVEANILRLNEFFRLPYINTLVQQKLDGYETDELAAGHGLDFYTAEYLKLEDMLQDAADHSDLPKQPGGEAELSDLLLQLREMWA